MRWLISNRNTIVFFMLLAFLFEPNSFTHLGYVNVIYGALSVIVFVSCLIVYIIKRKKISLPIFFIGGFLLLLLTMTIINNGDVLKIGYMCANFGAFIMLCDLAFKQNKSTEFILGLFMLLSLLLFINLLFIPKTSNTGIYFLGIRTRIVDYALPQIFSGIILLNKKKKILNLAIIIGLIISIINLFVFNVSTAWMGLIIIFIVYLVLKSKISNVFLNNYVLIGMCFLAVIGITFFNAQHLFSGIIEKITGKGTDFTGRTEIWKSSFDLIKEKIIFGHGLINDGNFVPKGNALWQAHNAYLQILYDTGIVGLMIMITYIIFSFGCRIVKRNNKQIVCSAFMTGLMIMMIVETYTYYMIFYIFASITYGINRRNNLK